MASEGQEDTDQPCLAAYLALCEGDMVCLRTLVDQGLDIAKTTFTIQTEEVCACAAAFENLGLEDYRASLRLDWWQRSETTSPETDQKGRPDLLPNRDHHHAMIGQAENSLLYHWLKCGQCSHVSKRDTVSEQLLFLEEDDLESDDDFGSDFDLRVYGVQITPSPAMTESQIMLEELRSGGPDITKSDHMTASCDNDSLYMNASQASSRMDGNLNESVLALNLDEHSFQSEGDQTSPATPTSDQSCKTPTNSVPPTGFPRKHLLDSDIIDILSAQTGEDTKFPRTTSLQQYQFPDIEGLEDLLVTETGSEVIMADIQESGVTAVHIAAAMGHCDILSYLLERGCEVNVSSLVTEDTPLHMAVRKGHVSVVSKLLAAGADLCLRSESGLTPVEHAIELDREDCLAVMLQHPSIVNISNESSRQTILLHVISRDKPKLLQYLLETGWQKLEHKGDEETLYNALQKAAALGAIDCLELLLSRGCNPNITDREGETPLHQAAANGHVTCVRALLLAGAKARPAPCWMLGDNQTPLMLAAYNNFPEVVEALLKASDVNIASEFGDTALHYAAFRGCVSSVEALLQAGADPNVANVYGATPLWNAACNVEVLQMLLDAGAKVDVSSTGHSLDQLEFTVFNEPHSALQVALSEGFMDSGEMLVRANCHIPVDIDVLLTKAAAHYDDSETRLQYFRSLLSPPFPLWRLAARQVQATCGNLSSKGFPKRLQRRLETLDNNEV